MHLLMNRLRQDKEMRVEATQRPFLSPSGALESLESRIYFSSIAGSWQGTRSEDGLGGTFAVVTINMRLTQSGQNVSGSEKRTSPKDSEYFADLQLHGAI